MLLKFYCQEKWVADIIEQFVDNFYAYDFTGNLVEDDDNEGEHENDFNTVNIIEEDWSEHHESVSENNEETRFRTHW